MLSLAAFAAGLGWMAPVQAGNVVCKASVQDAHGIASGWIGHDGRQAVPLKGLFVFPPGTVAREAGASDYQLGKPAHLPPDTLFVSAQFALAMDGNDLHVGLDTLEIDGPSIARTDGGAVDPLFVLAPGADAVLPTPVCPQAVIPAARTRLARAMAAAPTRRVGRREVVIP